MFTLVTLALYRPRCSRCWSRWSRARRAAGSSRRRRAPRRAPCGDMRAFNIRVWKLYGSVCIQTLLASSCIPHKVVCVERIQCLDSPFATHCLIFEPLQVAQHYHFFLLLVSLITVKNIYFSIFLLITYFFKFHLCLILIQILLDLFTKLSHICLICFSIYNIHILFN